MSIVKTTLTLIVALVIASDGLIVPFTLSPSRYLTTLFSRKNPRSAYPPEFLDNGQSMNFGDGGQRKTEKKRMRNKFSHLRKLNYDIDDDEEGGSSDGDDSGGEIPSISDLSSSTERTVFTASEDLLDMRIDAALHSFNPTISRTIYAEMIKNNKITVNQKQIKKSYLVQTGDLIVIEEGESNKESSAFALSPEAIDLDILFEDDSMIVINKAADMVVHPDAGNWNGTMVNALIHYFGKKWLGEFDHSSDSESTVDDARLETRPGIVHRLDKDTTGVIIVAKSQSALRSLSSQFQRREVSKKYLAVLLGNPGEDVKIEKNIGRHPVHRQRMRVVPEHTAKDKGKSALTYVDTIGFDGRLSFAQVRIETGRTHQIRVHLSDRGTPIYGDTVYGNKDWNEKLRRSGEKVRPLLHSYEIEINHPISQERMKFVAPMPDDMVSVVRGKIVREEDLIMYLKRD